MHRHMNETLVRRRLNTSTALPSRCTTRVIVIACALAVLAFPVGRQVPEIEFLLPQPRVAQAQDVSTPPIPGLAAQGSVAFDGDREGANLWDEIYVMNLDGSGERRVTPTTHSCHAQSPRWSPNGHQIAFHCLVDNDSVPPVTIAEDIFIINDDGTGLTQITQFGSALAGFASWSHDGRRITFVGDQCNMCARHIYILDLPSCGPGGVNPDGINLDSCEVTPVAVDSVPVVGGRPDWSPDGQKLAFNRNNGVWVMELNDPGGAVSVAPPSGGFNNANPRWSPNGQNIAFEHNKPRTLTTPPIFEIYLMEADGQDQHKLTSGSFPSWSPDGRWIVFQRQLCGVPGESGHADLFMIPFDGTDGEELQITNKACPSDGSTPTFSAQPGWAPGH